MPSFELPGKVAFCGFPFPSPAMIGGVLHVFQSNRNSRAKTQVFVPVFWPTSGDGRMPGFGAGPILGSSGCFWDRRKMARFGAVSLENLEAKEQSTS